MSLGPEMVLVGGRLEPKDKLPVIEKAKPTKLAVMLRMWLSYHGLEQRDFAAEIGCSPSTVTRFLAGHAMPDGTTTARIIAWLFESSNDQLHRTGADAPGPSGSDC